MKLPRHKHRTVRAGAEARGTAAAGNACFLWAPAA